MATKDKRLELIAAYREAGLHEKADALVAEMFREHGITPPSEAQARLNKLKSEMDATLNKIHDKLGIPRKPPRKRR